MKIKKINAQYEDIINWAKIPFNKFIEDGPEECPYCLICPIDNNNCTPNLYHYPDLKNKSNFSLIIDIYDKIKNHFKMENHPKIYINDRKMKVDIEVLHMVDKEFPYKDYKDDFQNALYGAIIYYYNTYIKKND